MINQNRAQGIVSFYERFQHNERISTFKFLGQTRALQKQDSNPILREMEDVLLKQINIINTLNAKTANTETAYWFKCLDSTLVELVNEYYGNSSIMIEA